MSRTAGGACDACLSRALLLARLSPYLEHAHADRGLLDETLALEDEQLVAALVPGPSAPARLLEARDPAAERARVRAAGVLAVCRHEDGYPEPLRDLEGPPAVLFVAGAAGCGALIGAAREEFGEALTGASGVAVVGARRASSYGLDVARALGRGLSAAGVTVLSGMALGVDSAAHAGALDRGARTVAVLAGGVDVPYPASKRALYAALRERATLVSEMPLGFRPRRWSFPARNRIIAALAALTVVVEAARRSGALITARVARELGREVGAVPGQVTSPVAAGSNALLRDGAHLVDGPQAALDLLFGAGARSVPGTDEPDGLEPGLHALLAAVRTGRGSLDELVAGRDPREVLAGLSELELRGLVRRAPGGAYVPLP
jgi:DNA processing protein